MISGNKDKSPSTTRRVYSTKGFAEFMNRQKTARKMKQQKEFILSHLDSHARIKRIGKINKIQEYI